MTNFINVLENHMIHVKQTNDAWKNTDKYHCRPFNMHQNKVKMAAKCIETKCILHLWVKSIVSADFSFHVKDI